MEHYLREQCFDDASLFQGIRLLREWVIPRTQRPDILVLADWLSKAHSPIACVAGIWLLAKYGTGEELLRFLKSTRSIWTANAFAGRQVAAVSEGLRVIQPS